MTVSTRLLVALSAAGALALGSPVAVEAQPQGGGNAQQQDLPSLLHLRPDQMASFHAFQSASQPNPDEIGRLRAASPQSLTGLTTPQRLDRIASVLSTQQEMFHRSADATRAFYGQLSPDQKTTFDRLSAPPPNQGRGRSQ